MHPYRYDGSQGPHAALLERLAAMGEKRERDGMPGWRDPVPFLRDDDMDSHMFDIRQMAERDQPTLHEADTLKRNLGLHAVVGANSAMNSLRDRQEALEVIEQRFDWLAGYLTPERLDRVIEWRDQKARRSAESSRMWEHQSRANVAVQQIGWTIEHAYADPDAARANWAALLGDPDTGGLKEAARQVARHPERLGALKGANQWFGLGGPNRERERALERLAELPLHANVAIERGKLADRYRRRHEALADPGRPDAEMTETMAAARDVRRINLHYMIAMQDKVVQARALIGGQQDNPVQSLIAADRLYAEWSNADDPGTRITAGQLKRGMGEALYQLRRDPALQAELAASGGTGPEALFSDRRPDGPTPDAGKRHEPGQPQPRL